MKKILAISLITFFLTPLLLSQPENKYIPRSERKKEKYKTAEPGTYLKPSSYSMLKQIEKAKENPSRQPSDKMLKMLSSKQKQVTDTVLNLEGIDVPIRIYYPTKRSLSGMQEAILFFHGGGFIMGSIDQYHMMVAELARKTGMPVISVGYRLATEYPFPAGLTDCYNVYLWLRSHGGNLGIDTENIFLMGDSAGGNLATVVTLMCRDFNQAQPRGQILIYPATCLAERDDNSTRYFLMDPNREYILSETFIRKARTQYMGANNNAHDPYLSPLEASLSGDLPPALIITAECDPLRDSGRDYAAKLSKAGVPVNYIEYSGTIHGFMSLYLILKEGRDAMKEVREFIVQN